MSKSKDLPIIIGIERGETMPVALREERGLKRETGSGRRDERLDLWSLWTIDYRLSTTALLCSLLAICLVLSSCKAKKGASGNLKNKSTNFLVDQLQGNQLDVDWFSAKAKLIPSGLGMNTSFSANIRIKKDSLIWMNASKMSLEAARVLIRPDSVFILSRFDKIYYARPLSYVESEFNLPADFQLLQDMILGNAILFDGDNTVSKKLENRYILANKDEEMQLEYRLGNAPTYLLEEMSVNDSSNARSFSIDFSDYQIHHSKKNFAHGRKIKLNSAATGEAGLSIDFSKVEFNVPKKMPFSVSSRYEAR